MSRPKNNPDFDRDKLEAEIFKTVVEVFNSKDNVKKEVSYVAEMLEISALKARKLLITAGERAGDPGTYYTTPISDEVQKLYDSGVSIDNIADKLELSHASVIGYLPYTKTVYSMKQLSVDAERIKRFRERQKAVGMLLECVANTDSWVAGAETGIDGIGTEYKACADALWRCVILYQNFKFRTAGRGQFHSGAVDFTYSLKVSSRTGEATDELIISTRPEGKTITRSSVELAFKNALSVQRRD